MKRLLCLSALLLVVGFSYAEAAELTPEQIIDNSYSRQVIDHESAEAVMDMYMIEGDKVVQQRRLKTRARTVSEGGEKLVRVLMHFVEPADIKGTSFLSIERKGGDDDQWLYLPALNKVLRKGGQNGSSESFMGTEFTYGDMESKEVAASLHKRLPDEKLGALDCYVIESTPKNPREEGYGKYINYIDKRNFVPMRVKLFDLNGELFKVMMTEKVEKVDGKDTMTTIVMLNVKNKKATRLLLHNIKTGLKFTDADFGKERMTQM